MTRQQAGVSAEAIAKLVERLRNDIEASRSSGLGEWPELFLVRLDELEAALLATAPPEQARHNVSGASPVCLDCNRAGMRNCSHFDNCDGVWVYKPDLPQAASDGALELEKLFDEYVPLRPMHPDAKKYMFEMLAAALASHDKKVQAK